MQALFTGALGDFIGAESFMTEQEKDAVTTLLWATRNRQEIQEAINLKEIFPNLKEQKILFDNFSNERPTRPWQPGDGFMNIHKKDDLNTKCRLNLTKEELDAIGDYSLDATLERIFREQLRFQTSRIATRMSLPDISHLNLPEEYVVIHPWSDAEICGREFNDDDWNNIFQFLETQQLYGVVVNKSQLLPPVHDNIIDLTNKTNLQETFSIIRNASCAIMCSSSLACFASKLFSKGEIFIKGGHSYIFTDWATYFYHGPFMNPSDITFKNFDMLNPKAVYTALDQGYMSLI